MSDYNSDHRVLFRLIVEGKTNIHLPPLLPPLVTTPLPTPNLNMMTSNLPRNTVPVHPNTRHKSNKTKSSGNKTLKHAQSSSDNDLPPSSPPSGRTRSRQSRKWSAEEDRKLKELIKFHGGTDINWTQVASQMEDRTPEQCSQRYNRVINPNLRKEAWTMEEEEYIYNLTQSQPKPNWAKVGQSLKRSDVQIRYKYKRVIKSIKTTWTSEEIGDLYSSVQNSNNWYDVSSRLFKLRKYSTKRTPFDCKRQYLKLYNSDPFPRSRSSIDLSPQSSPVYTRGFSSSSSCSSASEDSMSGSEEWTVSSRMALSQIINQEQ